MKVSVIVPVYNAETTIERCVDSILKQSYAEFELIVVDDGSEDSSRQIIEGIASKDKRVMYVFQDNTGPGAARNTGLSVASGGYVVFVDADDTIKGECLATLVASIESFNVDYVGAGMDINGKEIMPTDAIIRSKKAIVRHVLVSLLIKGLIYTPTSKIFKKAIIDENEISFDESMRYGEDTVFVLGYLKCCVNMADITRVLYSYVYTHEGLSYRGAVRLDDRSKRTTALGDFMGDNRDLLNRILKRAILFRWWLSLMKARLHVS